jgi:tRNA modification GTPase
VIDPRNEEFIDEVLLTKMKAPYTFTREDIIEINGHGGVVPLRKILDLVVREGARLAEPGEFTKRAFLNGRIDLAQAESVAEIIRAKTDLSLKASLKHLKGEFSEKINSIRGQLVDSLAEIEALLDFPEEELEINPELLLKNLSEAKKGIEKLLSTTEFGKLLREGVRVAIVGRPNVGKSSILNSLLGENRAIVTPIPGTTRDTIEEEVNIEGILMRLIDTAGFRESTSLVEREGIKRTNTAIGEADLILLVLDGSEKLRKEDLKLMEEIKGREIIVIINKIDLPQLLEKELIYPIFSQERIVSTSALKKIRIEELRKKIKELFLNGRVIPSEELIITNARHQNALKNSLHHLELSIKGLKDDIPLEFVATHLRVSCDRLGEIIGATIEEEVLDRIFSKFCIGK